MSKIFFFYKNLKKINHQSIDNFKPMIKYMAQSVLYNYIMRYEDLYMQPVCFLVCI